ncbi:MAG: hypothetical protein LH632_02000 [Rhodoferax sp.]|nr:hypothetical protein [Rhodoferax sp.]
MGELESRAVLKACIEACAALAALKQATEDLCSAVCVGLLFALVLLAGLAAFEFKARASAAMKQPHRTPPRRCQQTIGCSYRMKSDEPTCYVSASRVQHVYRQTMSRSETEIGYFRLPFGQGGKGT